MEARRGHGGPKCMAGKTWRSVLVGSQAARDRPPKNGFLCVSGHSEAGDIGGVGRATFSEVELVESSI